MDFPLSRPLVSDLVYLPEVASTNDELVSRAVRGAPEFTVVATLNQTAGRGRLNRTWVAPPGQALAVSVLLRPAVVDDLDRLGWIPLIAGYALTRALRALVPPSSSPFETVAGAPSSGSGAPLPEAPSPEALEGHPPLPEEVAQRPSRRETPQHRVTLKWPNDVLVDGLKVSGLLAELLPDASGIVLGVGVNLTIPRDMLPVPTATSLLLGGVVMPAEEMADLVLGGFLTEFRRAYSRFLEHGGSAEASGLHADVSALCSTLGEQVRVQMPDGETVRGTAVDLDEAGRLRINRASDASVLTVAAGDVTHLRYE